METIAARDDLQAALLVRRNEGEALRINGRFSFTCLGPDGNVKWTDEADNLVVNAGKNYILDQSLAAGSASGTCYIGLIGGASGPTVAAGDTLASHAGWLESGSANPPTMSSTRQAVTWSAASGGVKQASASVSFSITGSGTVQGGFLAGNGATSAIANTSGTLISAAAFTGGARTVANGDTVQVSYSLTLS